MPKYRVTGPDGATYDVTAPEGTSEQDVMSYAQSQASKKKEAAPSSGFGGAFKTVEDIVRSLTSGVTRGFADEIRAGADANLRKLGKGGYLANLYSNPFEGEEYEAALATERERDKEISPWIRIPGEAIGLAATSMTPAGLGSAIAQGAGQGALYGFGSGEGGLANRAQSAGVAGVLGAGGGAAGYGISRMLQPRLSPDVTALRQAGVKPTVGQAVGGAAKTMEEQATSVPVLGPGIAQAQRRAIESFDVAAINKALKPAGLRLPSSMQAGRRAIVWAGDKLSNQYDDLLGKMTASWDDAFLNDMRNVMSAADENLTPELNAAFTKKMQSLFSVLKGRTGTSATGLGTTGTATGRALVDPSRIAPKKQFISGEHLKEVMSSLKTLERQFSKAGDPFQRNLGEMYGAARDALSGLLGRHNPTLTRPLKNLDRAYANFVRVETAAARTGSKEGIFTPAALNAAARTADSSVRKRGFARGQSLMQDFASQGERVLGNAYPDSGTAGRTLLPYLTAGTAFGATVDPVSTGIALSALGGARAAYTPTGQALLAALLAGNRPQAFGPIARGVGAAGPGVAALAPLLQGRQ